jgi:hypothetical protein
LEAKEKMWTMLTGLMGSMKTSKIDKISLAPQIAMRSALTMYDALQRFESSVKAEAQSEPWILRKRKIWFETSIQNLSAWSLAHFASALLTMERHIKTEAQEAAWLANTRTAWVALCTQCGGKVYELESDAEDFAVAAAALFALLK